LIDGHTHIQFVSEAVGFSERLDGISANQVGVACQYENQITNTNPAGLVLKHSQPERFYLLAGLEHAALLYQADHSLPLKDQPAALHSLGADGIKLLASKPTERKRLGTAVDGPYFEEFFAVCEKLDIPLLWHVADPEEFWEPERLPSWAQEQGWGYDSSYLPKSDLYHEAENVLRRHPRLHVVFPHFYFLSADLSRAEAFLEEFPHAHLDLAPGIELYYNLSFSWEKSQDFFCRYSNRILFGTDILGSHTALEVQRRAGIVYLFLTGQETFRVPERADFLLGPASDGIIRGLALPQVVIDNITRNNFQRIFGPRPRPLDAAAAKEECLRLARIEAEVTSLPLTACEGTRAAQIFRP
jgi:predicted TIM-barrel fold metal-dependent hydrolase